MKPTDEIDALLNKSGETWRNNERPLPSEFGRSVLNANRWTRSRALPAAASAVLVALVGVAVVGVFFVSARPTLIASASATPSDALPTRPATYAPSQAPSVSPGATPQSTLSASPTADASPADLPSPTPEPSPPPSTSPEPTAPPSLRPQLDWKAVDSGAGLNAIWSPDSQHFLIEHEDQVQVFDAAGKSVSNFHGIEAVWLDSNTVEAYDPANYPPAGPGPDGYADYFTVHGESLDVTTGAISTIDLPCCYPVSNGHGAVAVTRYLDETSGVKRPNFVIWHQNQPSMEQDGEPLAWDLAGDRLAVLHPAQPGQAPKGSLEVVSWPNMGTVYSSQSQDVPDAANFDPTGNYLAYSRTSSGGSRFEIDVVDLSAGSLATVALAGDATKDSQGYVWNEQSQIVTFTSANAKTTTYEADGTAVGESTNQATTYYEASSDGTTLVGFQVDLNSGHSTQLVAYRHGASAPMNAPDGVSFIDISPDGTRVVVIAGSPSSETAYLAALPL